MYVVRTKYRTQLLHLGSEGRFHPRMTSDVTTAHDGPSRALIAGVVAVVLLAIGALVLLTRGDDGDAASDEVRHVTVTGSTLPVLEPPGDPTEGTEAPAVAGEDFDGQPVVIEPDGRPKVIVFVAHWGPHCQEEVPVLAEWLAENGPPDDVDLYAVSSRTDPQLPNHPPSAWLEREGFDVPTIADDEDASALTAFGASAFPFFVALDGEHRVVARTSGEIPIDEWEELLARASGD